VNLGKQRLLKFAEVLFSHFDVNFLLLSYKTLKIIDMVIVSCPVRS